MVKFKVDQTPQPNCPDRIALNSKNAGESDSRRPLSEAELCAVIAALCGEYPTRGTVGIV